MAVIILGSNPITEYVGLISPISIPVESLPVRNILLLNNPLLIRSSFSVGSTDSFWSRNTSYEFLTPTIASDKVVIGGNSFIGDSIFSVRGNSSTDKLYLTSGSYITMTDGELSFTDTISNTVKLSELLTIGSNKAVDVTIDDVLDYYNATNVEDALIEIAEDYISIAHFHSNKLLLDSYDQSNDDIIAAITGIHEPVTIFSNSALFAVGQQLDVRVADAITTGVLLAEDWVRFNEGIGSSDILTAISQLTLSNLSLIYGIDGTTATMLTAGTALQYLRVNSSEDALEWADLSELGAFAVPAGFTSISNEIGDISNAKYPDVSTLNGKPLSEILSEMLFPIPLAPTYVLPTNQTTYTITSSSFRNGLYLEKGQTVDITVNSNLYSANGPGGKAYAVQDGTITYTLDGFPYVNGGTIELTDSAYVFVSTIPTTPNTLEEVTLPNGTVVTAASYLGATDYSAVSTSMFTTIDPIYYKAYTSVLFDIDTPPDTATELQTYCNKLIGPRTGFVQIPVPTYTGAVNPNRLILIAFPDTAGTLYLSSIKYVEGSNAEVISSFNRYQITYDRANSTSQQYTVYVALNAYTNVTGTVTYNVYL